MPAKKQSTKKPTKPAAKAAKKQVAKVEKKEKKVAKDPKQVLSAGFILQLPAMTLVGNTVNIGGQDVTVFTLTTERKLKNALIKATKQLKTNGAGGLDESVEMVDELPQKEKKGKPFGKKKKDVEEEEEVEEKEDEEEDYEEEDEEDEDEE